MAEKKHHRRRRTHGAASKHKKHKKKHKRRRRRRSRAPVGMPSIPTLEQNQYWLLHGRIAALENQAMQATQRSGGEKTLSRAEEVDIANRVIDENLKKARDRDNARPPENALDDEDINFLKETRRELEKEERLKEERFQAFEEAHGLQQGGDDDTDDESVFDVSELADPEMGSLLADRDKARHSPPESPPQPQPEPQPLPARVKVAPDVVDPLFDTTSADLGPSLADELAATTSPVFAQQENRPGDRRVDALQRRIEQRQRKIRTLSDTG